MTIDMAIDMIQKAMIVVAQAGGPPLIAAMVIGVVVGIAQTVTQINDQSITFVSKMIVVGAATIIAGPFALGALIAYMREMFSSIARVVQ